MKKNIQITFYILFIVFVSFGKLQEVKAVEKKGTVAPIVKNDKKTPVKKPIKAKTKKATIKETTANEAADAKVILSITERLGKLMSLPDEEPLVASIVDVKTLKKTQNFYNDARDGDTLIIYLKARKAIIYDGVNNKIVNVGPLGDIKTE